MAQSTFDYSTPSAALKSAEALAKVAATGTADQYKNISNGISMVKNQDGSSTAFSTLSGKPIANIAGTQDNVSPSDVPKDANQNKTDEYKVILSQEPTYTNISDKDVLTKLVLDVMPTIDETKSATYTSFQPNQHPGEILKYTGSSARQWQIHAQLISRDISEANLTLDRINLVRSWVMPFYGEGTSLFAGTKSYLGAPPPIITLTAYGDGAIGPVKCVVESYNVSWPNDVDYIQTDAGQPIPVIMTISLSLKESWSPAEWSSFDLYSYRLGIMGSAFNTAVLPPAGQTTPAVATTNPDTVTKDQPTVSTTQASNQAAAQSTLPLNANGTINRAAIYGSSPGGGHKSGAGHY